MSTSKFSAGQPFIPTVVSPIRKRPSIGGVQSNPLIPSPGNEPPKTSAIPSTLGPVSETVAQDAKNQFLVSQNLRNPQVNHPQMNGNQNPIPETALGKPMPPKRPPEIGSGKPQKGEIKEEKRGGH